jgi:hypothetical protein
MLSLLPSRRARRLLPRAQVCSLATGVAAATPLLFVVEDLL